MKVDGVKFKLETDIQQIKDQIVTFKNNGSINEETFDKVLFSIGKTPNVEGIGLEQAGIEYDSNGIKVSDRLQTTNKNIYAVGDCIPGPCFTHNSDAQARLVMMNALFYDQKKNSKIILPSCTYTSPEIASIGQN